MRLLIVFSLLFSPAWAETLSVFAASSLTEAFTEMAAAFEAEHPEVTISLNFAGSSTLATQLEQGAPADVFASADLPNLLRVVSEEAAVIFASNHLVVVTGADSGITDLAALAEGDYLLVLAGETVPIGRYAREVLTNLNEVYGEDYAAQVLGHLVSSEPNVRQVMAKVLLGEVDAALVYATDATAFPELETLEIPTPYNVSALYPVAVLAEGKKVDLANRFVAFLLSDQAQTILKDLGFQSIP